MSLRITSTILRVLLVEDNLGKVWRLIGFKNEPMVRAVDLEALLDGVPKLRVNFASAGGAVYHGQQVQGVIVYDTAMSDAYLKRRCELQKDKGTIVKDFSLSAFRESPCLLVTWRFPTGIKQEKIRRRELVQYVVNKLGGAHIDMSRNPDREMKYILLDWVYNQMNISEKEAVYFELLSIGQSLINSPDIETLLNSIK